MNRYIDELAKAFGIDPAHLTDKQRLQASLLIAQAQVEALNSHKVADRAYDIVEEMIA